MSWPNAEYICACDNYQCSNLVFFEGSWCGYCADDECVVVDNLIDPLSDDYEDIV